MKQATKTTKAVQVVKASKLNHDPINAPKHNGITSSCYTIIEIAKNAKPTKPGLTNLGHIANCKGGIIDACILSGKANCLQHFIDALVNSGLKVVNEDIINIGHGKALQVHLAKRVVDHVNWCANTLNQSHGGFGDRLKKVQLENFRAEIAQNLKTLASCLEGGLTVLRKA